MQRVSDNAKNEVEMHREVTEAAGLLRHLVTVARIDVQQEASAMFIDMFKLDDTPTVRIVRQGGQIIKYEGNVTAKELVYAALTQWRAHTEEVRLERENAPAVYKLEQARDTAQMLASGSSVCLGFFGEKDVNTTVHNVFHRVAKVFRGAVTVGEANSTLAAALNVSKMPGVSMYNPEVGTTWYQGNWTQDNLATWVEEHRLQYFTHLTNENWEDFNSNKDGRAAAVLMGNLSDPSATKWVLGMRQVAANFQKQISFWYIDNEAGVDLAQKFGLSPTAQHKLVIWHAQSQKHFNFQPRKVIKPTSVEAFCQEYITGNLRPTYKSAPRPQPSDQPVVQVVGDTFREIMGDPTADVVMLLFDSTSKEAAILVDTYAQIAQTLSDTDGIVVASMDVHENDLLPECNQEIPSITMYLKGKKGAPVSYKGAVRYNNIMDWMSQYAVSSIDTPDSENALTGDVQGALELISSKIL